MRRPPASLIELTRACRYPVTRFRRQGRARHEVDAKRRPSTIRRRAAIALAAPRSANARQAALGSTWSSGGVRSITVERVVADMVRRHVLLDQVLADQTVGQAFLEVAEEQLGLPLVRMVLVVAQHRILAEQLAADPVEQHHRVEQVALGRDEVDRQARLPGLGLAPRVVDHLGLGRELVEIVPLGLDQADRRRLLVAEVHPLLVLALAGEQRVEIVLELPVLELGAVEQHDAGRVVRRRAALPAHDRLALHVAATAAPRRPAPRTRRGRPRRRGLRSPSAPAA